jgi:hypothetical protein
LVASALIVTEVSRAVRRAVGRSHDSVLTEVLGLIDLVVVDHGILAAAPTWSRPACALWIPFTWPAPLPWATVSTLWSATTTDDRRLEVARAPGLAVERPSR